jgi:hypothetical protein
MAFTDEFSVAHWYNADTLTASPSQINFLIFVPLFSFLSIVYLEVTPRFLARGKAHQEQYIFQMGAQERKLTLIASHPYAHFAFEIINMLFYFAGFVALATFLGKLLFCRGSVCAAARADAVFAAFSWLVWTGTSAMLALEIFKGGFSGVKTDRQAKSAMKEAVMTEA